MSPNIVFSTPSGYTYSKAPNVEHGYTRPCWHSGINEFVYFKQSTDVSKNLVSMSSRGVSPQAVSDIYKSDDISSMSDNEYLYNYLCDLKTLLRQLSDSVVTESHPKKIFYLMDNIHKAVAAIKHELVSYTEKPAELNEFLNLPPRHIPTRVLLQRVIKFCFPQY
ncbi:hypothetical protein DID76_01075 [Candidatus Marinamargulisbacteria bacterium SCGC AG-414-C22]|nr:hypothetical protein DID76_01075 [Candidatus Marinamargulisbacteria bacterium SCGC AG-414-C22]